MAKVVNLKKSELKKLGFNSLEEWLDSGSGNHVYIGRDMTHYVPGAVGSKWANPFKGQTKEWRLKSYEQHVRSRPDLMSSLEELEGKVLGCWCHPEGCHGDVLLKLVKEKNQIK